jgi:hypothetical protein
MKEGLRQLEDVLRERESVYQEDYNNGTILKRTLIKKKN